MKDSTIVSCFISPNVADANGESANVVDVINYAASAMFSVSRSICDNAVPGKDAAGGSVRCLTEAVMGVTAGLSMIADAILRLAEAVAEKK